jgi:repressor LexA
MIERRQKLTARQREVLDFIRSFIRRQGYAPSLREIGDQFNIRSTNGVNDHLTALERKGFLRRTSNKSRTLQPTEGLEDDSPSLDEGAMGSADESSRPRAANEDGTVRVEVKGTVAATDLLEIFDGSRGSFVLDRALLGVNAQAEVFALEVRGASMIDAGILEGDTVFVRRTSSPARGDIVVARVNGTATIKRYFPEKDHVRLQPENKAFAPIIVRHAQLEQSAFEVVGVVTGLFRRNLG